MTHHRSITRSIATGVMITIALVALSSRALATQVQNTPVKIAGFNDVADFGSGLHAAGSPAGNGSVKFDYVNVNGQVVATARVQGTLYWDALRSGCGRLIITYRDLGGNTLATQNVNTACPAPGLDASHPFGAADTANQASVDRSFSSSRLHSVRLRTAEVVGTSRIIQGNATVNAPRTRSFSVSINHGVSDFGREPHLYGMPLKGGTVSFTRTNGSMSASVTGTLFHDCLLGNCISCSLDLSGGNSVRIRVKFQNPNGDTLSSRRFDLRGAGCCATHAGHQLHVDTATVMSGSLWQVQLRVGEISTTVPADDCNMIERTVDYNGPLE